MIKGSGTHKQRLFVLLEMLKFRQKVYLKYIHCIQIIQLIRNLSIILYYCTTYASMQDCGTKMYVCARNSMLNFTTDVLWRTSKKTNLFLIFPWEDLFLSFKRKYRLSLWNLHMRNIEIETLNLLHTGPLRFDLAIINEPDEPMLVYLQSGICSNAR